MVLLVTSIGGCFGSLRLVCLPSVPALPSTQSQVLRDHPQRVLRQVHRIWSVPFRTLLSSSCSQPKFQRCSILPSLRAYQKPTAAMIGSKEENGGGSGAIVVAALGGNALLQRGQPLTMENQQLNARGAAAALAALVKEEGVSLCITHGNGPQVGLLAEQDPETALDVLGAESEGQIGYLVELELLNQMPNKSIIAVLTKTVVDPSDPAFKDPSKFIGPMYSEEDAERLRRDKGWVMAPDGGKGYRRVVASPTPLRIQEADAIQLLLKNDIMTICCGGGGIPVADDGSGTFHGSEAVVDKDAASSLLAKGIKADVLLLLTDASAVFDPRKWPEEKTPLPSPVSIDDLEGMEFARGSMGPKIKAACDFVRTTGGVAGIGSLGDALGILRGEKGTLIVHPHSKKLHHNTVSQGAIA